MDSSKPCDIPHYSPALPTTVDLDYADLPIIDLSNASNPEGRAALSIQVRDAMTEYGFFYVINHGYPMSKTVKENFRHCQHPL